MSRRPDDDATLRDLLASIGITEESMVPREPTEADLEQIRRTMERIRSLPDDESAVPADVPARSRWRPQRTWAARAALAAAACVIFALIVVVQPWGGTSTAVAQTPAMLHFANVRAGDIPPAGDPAGELLDDLAARAATLPEPADLPVQRVELDAWWASTAIGSEEAPTQSVLVPVKSVAYTFPNGERRAMEYRGEPLDADGRPAQGDLDWLHLPPTTDDIFPLDPVRGSDYPLSLPEDPAELVEMLAPAEACAETRGGCLLIEAISLFEMYVVPPDVTSRVWEAFATEPSITTLGETVDRHGRRAVVLTSGSINPREQVLILVDPVSGAYLGSEVILIAPSEAYGFDPPAVISFASVVSAERVAESDVPDDSTATRY